MILRVKDLWMRSASLERVLTAKRNPLEAQLLAANGELLLDALNDYKLWRERKWEELGGNKGLKSSDNPNGWTRDEFPEIKRQFNDLAAEEGEREVSILYPPISVALLHEQLSVEDFVAAKQVWLLKDDDG